MVMPVSVLDLRPKTVQCVPSLDPPASTYCNPFVEPILAVIFGRGRAHELAACQKSRPCFISNRAAAMARDECGTWTSGSKSLHHRLLKKGQSTAGCMVVGEG